MADLSPDARTASLLLDRDPQPVSDDLVRVLAARRFAWEHDDPRRAEEAARSFVDRVLPEVTSYVVRVAPAGSGGGRVWLVDEDQDVAVLALELDDPAHAGAVRDALVQHARSVGSSRLRVGVTAGDPTLEAFVAGSVGGQAFEAAAFQMRLALDGPDAPGRPDDDALSLVRMDQAAFDDYMRHSVSDYAADRQRAGESPEHAVHVARTQLASLLPDGLATPHHHFFHGVVEGERVGVLWLGTERPLAFVYDVVVEEAHRRRGKGEALMRAGARCAREHGASDLGLNVFGFNEGAKALYDRLGFEVVETHLVLALGEEPVR